MPSHLRIHQPQQPSAVPLQNNFPSLCSIPPDLVSRLLLVFAENLTMSGFEVAGVILGAFPLVIYALDELTKQLSPSSSLKLKCKVYRMKLATQKLVFSNILEKLLVPLVADNETFPELLSSPEGEGWRDPRLANLLKKRLGHASPVFLECIERMGQVVRDMQRELSIDSGDIAGLIFTMSRNLQGG
ncbi:hypothetical protein B0T24DRAFT_205530 [Lasiosphaeria ovina]|uniref:Uncharacterized protein n=1 Tax=Lasiosphaeria ovina TaxID=92902 RepID=A0AAE0KGB6_9PEZI|nr:hypothetical protein B0T24DRAFT_205530 [Lasiosphaeria ovina]